MSEKHTPGDAVGEKQGGAANEEGFKSMCARLERLKRERAEATGAAEELRRQLAELCGATTVKAGRAAAEELRRKADAADERARAEYARIEKEFPQLFEE